MLYKSILNFAQSVNPNIDEKDIESIYGGFSSQAYKVSRKDKAFVLLVQRSGAVSKPNYGHAFIVLKLLEAAGYRFAPKPLWLDQHKEAIAISFFDGQASDSFNFEGSKVDKEELSIRVIDALLDASAISRDDYVQLCQKHDVTPLPIRTAIDDAKEFGTDWLNIVKESCPDKKIAGWLEPRVANSVELANSTGQDNAVLRLGDPSNPNILIKKSGDFMLIDWDSAQFHTNGPEFYVAYTTNLTDFMKPYREEITKHVATRTGVTVEELSKQVFDYRRYTEVFDVNWAAMMMAKVNSGEVEGDIDEFRKIAKNRIAIYEDSFEQ